jgi:hypothetical protein
MVLTGEARIRFSAMQPVPVGHVRRATGISLGTR